MQIMEEGQQQGQILEALLPMLQEMAQEGRADANQVEEATRILRGQLMATNNDHDADNDTGRNQLDPQGLVVGIVGDPNDVLEAAAAPPPPPPPAPAAREADIDAEEGQAEQQQQQPEGEEPAANTSNAFDYDDINPFGASDPFRAPNTGNRMILTAVERTQAQAIKVAIESSDDVDNLTDFEYAQLALVDGDDVESSLDRAEHFQAFREQYRIRDSYEEAKRMWTRMVLLWPDAFLSLSYYQETNNFVYVIDFAGVSEKLLRTPGDYRNLYGLGYYVGVTLSPDFEAIRNGIIIVAECQGYSFQNITINTQRKVWSESIFQYPFKINQLKFFHNGLFINIILSLIKRIMPGDLSSKFEVGCQFPGRLDQYYAVPTREIATRRFLDRVDVCLEQRYENMKNFRL